MHPVPSTTGRAAKLSRFFKTVACGRRSITSTEDAQLYIEAICSHESPAICVETLSSSQDAYGALRTSVRCDVSVPFIEAHTLRLIRFLAAPEVKTLAEGQMLRKLLHMIIQPPTFWNSMINGLLECRLQEESLQPCAWLIYEMLIDPSELDVDVAADAKSVLQIGDLLKAKAFETREITYKIQKLIQLRGPVHLVNSSYSPGGRHDNDFADFRQIAIYPTTDEFLATDKPYYRRGKEIFELDSHERAAAHLDNQFRLLREDMLGELREELQVATGKKRGSRSAMVLDSLLPVSLELGREGRGRLCSVALECFGGLERLRKLDKKGRRRFLDENQNFLRHQSFGALLEKERICGFAFVNRDLDSLANEPPIVCLQFTDSKSLGNALIALKSPNKVQFVLLNTPVFAYAPILTELKSIEDLPLQNILLHLSESGDTTSFEPPATLQRLASRLSSTTFDSSAIQLKGNTALMDESQLKSLANALISPVSLIQGPPGTGKSFLGSKIVKYMRRCTDLRILVISYTNHALDQFLEELVDAGIRQDDMVRLGSKSTQKTQSMLLPRSFHHFKIPQASFAVINELKGEQSDLGEKLLAAFHDFIDKDCLSEEILEYLEFSERDRCFYDALHVPLDRSQWKKIGKRGKEVKEDYLYLQWKSGNGPGIFHDSPMAHKREVWDMPPTDRQQHVARWKRDIVQERVAAVEDLSDRFDKYQNCLDDLFKASKTDYVRSKRVIACTTTAAAMQQKLIRDCRPDVVLVEEAGEILESHILTALTPSVKQLILIGDHKQLRPKVNNYALTVERGEGYDLNRSMFERLILQGFKPTTLLTQHRMDPEISLFPHALTYPDLRDGPRTANRPPITGLQDRVIFMNHEHPESAFGAVTDRLDGGSRVSKENDFESAMVLNTVRYLAQQGYGTDRMVVLTPYLGQLRQLRQKLQEENDPVLNDIDASALVQAGLMTHAASKVGKAPLRISTIDNYQGEESDIVIASLTRSNSTGEIGFMSAAERLNVLITRARNCLVMVGNMDTFMKSRGSGTWVPFFRLLKERGHLYDGLPVKCERHPDKTAVLASPIDFDLFCPDGGCTEPCLARLNCGLHQCQRRCHRVSDHSKVACTHKMEKTCKRQHKIIVNCATRDDPCARCVQEDKEQERLIKRDLGLERERLARQQAYAQELQRIQDEIDLERRKIKYSTEEEDQKKSIAQQKEDLKNLKDSVSRMAAIKSATGGADSKTNTKGPSRDVLDANFPKYVSNASDEWEYLKANEGARSDPLDELMAMIGLEEVKQAFLNMKNTVDVKLRRNESLSSQRFGCSLLGNPGTGKTTVARLYAKFLTSIGVLPGARFEETTGSKLANLGVTGCQKLIDDILNNGGGVMFIDEAYQLTSGNSYGGAGVLDYLLPEVENLTGKIVFVLAGYDKQMESFFAHNPGLPSRFPIEMKFADYSDDDLLRIFALKIAKQYNGLMKCEDGLEGLYCRIVSRRIGRGRGREGFGNARTVENMLARIAESQAKRVFKERRAGLKPDDFLLSKEDLIGPQPSAVLDKSSGWQKLQKLIGLSSVKEAVKSLLDSVEQNYHRELEEQPPVEYSLNKVFLGNPGTGKTTVAKLYGQILVDLGLLSKGEVIVKNPSDFVGAALGASEQQTKGILASSLGKVLVIDEAYSLYGGGSQDPYKTAVIDTIVAEVQSVPGDDRCVLLLGYKDQMEDMFQNVNPGLSRRFPMSSAFSFADFNNDELQSILEMKLKLQGFEATGQAKGVALEMLDRARNRPHFGNAGEIDIILDAAKARHQIRFSRGEARSASVFEALDFDEHFDRVERSETNVPKLFEGVVGSEDIIKLLLDYQETVRTTKALDMDPKENLSFNFLFRGPPGTGKTTTARRMGKVFYDMGFLAGNEVIECSATDLIGQYVGQTGPKVQQLLDKALGKVLFIDEAYRLAEGGFAKDAINELVDSVTKEKYHKRLIIILAGYEKDINHLMSVNEGLTSRFPEVINFRKLEPQECIRLLVMRLASRRPVLQKKSIAFDLSVLEEPNSTFIDSIASKFRSLADQDSWASARDVETVAKDIFNQALRQKGWEASKRITITGSVVIQKLEALYNERESRSRHQKTVLDPVQLLTASATRELPKPTTTTSTVCHSRQTAPPEEEPRMEPPEEKKQPCRKSEDQSAQRDAGVSDAVWEQLQRDRQAEQEREEEYQRLLKAKDQAREEDRERLVRKILEEEHKRKVEAEKRQKLMQMGVCPVGYQWIKQDSGYRCAGGSHYMSSDQVDALCQ
ncbi:P-loop containing nucleoside triphosphate hydrolase protein [Xylariaceae sp. FL0016]|nr:P-loop containing nucleoside triphosphate hydrolase protein [Xylariaceae sp. FL0016]